MCGHTSYTLSWPLILCFTSGSSISFMNWQIEFSSFKMATLLYYCNRTWKKITVLLSFYIDLSLSFSFVFIGKTQVSLVAASAHKEFFMLFFSSHISFINSSISLKAANTFSQRTRLSFLC